MNSAKDNGFDSDWDFVEEVPKATGSNDNNRTNCSGSRGGDSNSPHSHTDGISGGYVRVNTSGSGICDESRSVVGDGFVTVAVTGGRPAPTKTDKARVQAHSNSAKPKRHGPFEFELPGASRSLLPQTAEELGALVSSNRPDTRPVPLQQIKGDQHSGPKLSQNASNGSLCEH
ncbi:hypothetical protein AJ79_05634 [Helicocarpus griseus UAMH5409]|uniref:Uncharacterized protein n=1 Tax=Helicocarpus griseus UAMH5409 TaxID=1447875 RepID=A0A2B7XM43_9EURO|nr:hypothetical protein AJ79_05634 [Helicocarpus griseus UAMH5409]